MARMIYADALEKHIADTFGYPAVDILHEIANFPTVDAVEVVHGRWAKSEYNGFLRCDHCKDVYIPEEWIVDGKWNYCPNCGARMDLEVE